MGDHSKLVRLFDRWKAGEDPWLHLFRKTRFDAQGTEFRAQSSVLRAKNKCECKCEI